MANLEWASITLIVTSSISVLGSFFVCFAYFVLKQYRNFALKLVLYLCIADLMGSLAVLIYNPLKFHTTNQTSIDGTMCKIQGYIKLSSNLSSYCFGCIISCILYLSVVRRVQNLERKEILFAIIGYGAPLIYSIIPLALGYIHPNHYFCDVIADQPYRTKWKVLYVYMPLWIGVLIMLVINAYVYYYLKKQQDISQEDIKQSKRILYYPFVLIFCGFFISIGFIFEGDISTEQDEKNTDSYSEYIFAIGQIFLSLQGILNAILYGLTPRVRSQIKKVMFSKKKLAITQSKQYSQSKDLAKTLLEANSSFEQQDSQPGSQRQEQLESNSSNMSIFRPSQESFDEQYKIHV